MNTPNRTAKHSLKIITAASLSLLSGCLCPYDHDIKKMTSKIELGENPRNSFIDGVYRNLTVSRTSDGKTTIWRETQAEEEYWDLTEFEGKYYINRKRVSKEKFEKKWKELKEETSREKRKVNGKVEKILREQKNTRKEVQKKLLEKNAVN